MLNTITAFFMNHTPLFYWTQSLWRDEAFSVWIAQDSLSELIRRTSGDFNPPLYYILLHYWLQIFGRSEIALRGLSVAFWLCFLAVVYIFAKKIFKSQPAAILTTALMAVNPMLLYFAFELRMYSLLILLATLSMYFFYTQNWWWHILATMAGMYTQPFMAFVVISQIAYLGFKKDWRRIGQNSIWFFLLYLPWIPTLLKQFAASGPMWMYPVDLNLVVSVLGNLYVGYEGTPGNVWGWMQILSVGIIVITFSLWSNAKLRRKYDLFFFWVYIPTFLVLGISLLKPIYVHRYVIFVTVGEVWLVSFYLQYLLRPKLKNWVGWSLVILTILIDLFAVSFHRKVDLRTTFTQVLPLLQPGDLVYAQTPLVYYETLYYVGKSAPVFLYNPQRITPPRYVGSVGMPESAWATSYPFFPRRAFTISESGSFRINSQLP
ncbi:MAG: hypothetical protein UV61_C0006G0164 [Candidatus Gottesmanbacteria bacterium GW2011_GWB1_43_11]|uniref:Glycosyltransferase RgtA/B/C/D-like domain-containing protein n=1 Tax=Candidatus Gottesmanbacteria bacterium GW2011_GWB1_43_11 TaxID=1618446 RepID=A0A0G1FJC7_9BACT|nr:MAG: hypothetical protein UV04_C0005G0163 [Candidatus Gottesmanbacteria bacterium GW2011_GWA2_42_16]KKS55654.1 MAG: hypothetical protein UV17_C0008G0005 [Candidatus Gottesmanbacteria bacterium GW2011_GWA1_42_26]KKS81495.1 MAG: hypothetical protein UV55_C0013G0037 [Candidatus Gottesmanbacteria bacterium GW2011_GWC1_43_10]KKS86963.1 MAG: hypothetical protein UV61_C0006G0164 [Candidatus Gottesmanbacteria bacterium GW2011_GWB1_43_11]OGG09534.1 MAG: hypothetical protein A2699_03275 [Candidatus Go